MAATIPGLEDMTILQDWQQAQQEIPKILTGHVVLLGFDHGYWQSKGHYTKIEPSDNPILLGYHGQERVQIATFKSKNWQIGPHGLYIPVNGVGLPRLYAPRN